MKPTLSLLAPIVSLLLASCATKRTPFAPDGPPTVGMPSALSDRERLFINDIDSALRREGLMPVSSGRGDLQLDFRISEGPINTDTDITLLEADQQLAAGHGRAAGVPMIGRSSVAEKSFSEAYAEFNEALTETASRRGWSSSSDGGGSVPSFGDNLPVY